jgi:hypothetical protein
MSERETRTRLSRAATTTPAVDFGGDRFDPLEEAERGFIERLLEEELEAALGRARSQRRRAARGAATSTLRTTFRIGAAGGAAARLADEASEREWKSELLPAYRRLSRRAELLMTRGSSSTALCSYADRGRGREHTAGKQCRAAPTSTQAP